MSITDKLNLLSNTKEQFKNLISDNGKTPTNVFSTYPDMLKDIIDEGGGVTPTPSPEPDPWERPSGRPSVPELKDNTILFLFGVQQDSPNDLAFIVKTDNGGGYTVSWGNVTRNYLSGATFEYEFNWNEIDENKGILENDYKMFWISVTPMSSSDSISELSFCVRPSGRVSTQPYVPQVFEMYIKCPELTALAWAQTTTLSGTSAYAMFTLLEIFSVEENKITEPQNFLLVHCYSLRQINNLYIESIQDYFMHNCYVYNKPFPKGVTFRSAGTDFMQQCSSYNQPFPEGVTFNSISNYFMRGCYAYNQPFPDSVTFNSVGNYFMNSCYAYNQPFPKGVTFSNASISFMYFCHSYNQPFPEGVTFRSMGNNFMQGCYSYNQPFPEGVTFDSVGTYFMANCYAYNQPFPDSVTFNSVGNYFMQICTAFNKNLPIIGLTAANALTSCYSLNKPIEIDIGELFTGVLFQVSGCYSLKNVRLLNMTGNITTVNVENCCLSADAIVKLFNDLLDRTSATTAGTVRLRGNPGVSNLLPDQIEIATNKNWTVVGG